MIFYIMGKSASGKDSLYKKLLSSNLKLNRVVIYTTRPKRDGESDGVEYNFVDKQFLDDNKEMIIEQRVYHTVFGDWFYATIDDGKIRSDKNYVMIGTLESYDNMKRYYGKDMIFPIYIEASDEIRRERAIKRENMQQVPKFDEMERRLKADEIDFSEENIKKAEIKKRYCINDLEKCFEEVSADIKRISND